MCHDDNNSDKSNCTYDDGSAASALWGINARVGNVLITVSKHSRI